MQKGLLPNKRVKGKRPLVFDIETRKKPKNFSRVLNLAKTKETFRFMALSLRDKKEDLSQRKGSFLKWKVSLIFAIVFYLAVGAGLVSLLHKSLVALEEKTATVNFYASYSETLSEPQDGEGWRNIEGALDKEDVSRSGDLDFFSQENSAVYIGGEHSLVLKEFITKEYIKISQEELNEEEAQEGTFEEDDPGTWEEEETNDEESNEEEEENEDTGEEEVGEEGSDENVSSEEEEIEGETVEEDEIVEEEEEIVEDIEDGLGQEEEGEETETAESVEEEIIFEETTEDGDSEDTNTSDGEETGEEVSLFESFKKVFALGQKQVRKYFGNKLAWAQWGANADDRNDIFGEFKNANIKISLATMEEFISESPPEEDDANEEEEPADEEEVEDDISSSTEEEIEEDPFVEEEEEEESADEEEIIVEEEVSEEEEEIEENPGFFDKVLDFLAPKEVSADESDSKITIWYSFASKDWEGPWKELAQINYSYFSNFTNNGYLNLEAPFLNDWKDIDDLRLKFEGRVNGSDFTAFLDSAWVAVEYRTDSDMEEEEEEVKEEEGDKNILAIDDEIIVFEHTDNNDNENLIIRSNKKDYVGLTQADVYFSIENIGARDEEIDIHFYFPKSVGEIVAVKKLYKNKPYLTQVPKYDAEVYGCDNGWDKREDIYICYPTGEERACDMVSPNRRYCRIERVRVGREKKIKYKHVWEDIKLTNRFIPDDRGFFKRLLGLGPQNKPVPGDFKRELSTDEGGIVLVPGEVQYFKATLKFPVNSLGEFYIETIGDADGYGLLDPWWSSSWDYRTPITIDNTGNASTLTDYQIYVEIPTSSTDFWENVKSDGGDVRFINPSEDGELDFWMQHFDSIASSASFWVQVDSIAVATTTDIFMYYGNAGATSTSDAYTPFTYSTMQDIFYVVASSSNANVEVISLIDSNEVQLDNQTSASLNRQDITTFTTATSTSILKAKGPVYVKVTKVANASALIPISFASTSFAIPSNRGTENFYTRAHFAVASTTIYDGDTQEQEQSVSQGSVWEVANDIGAGSVAIVEADSLILLAFNNNTPADGLTPYPATGRDLYGIRSQNNYIGATATNTSFTIYCSGNSSTTVSSLGQGVLYTNVTCANGSEGTGNAVRIKDSNNSLGAIQQDDTDGDSSTVFLPFKEFSSEYMVPTDAAYIAVACAPKSGSIELSVYNESDSFVSSTTCSGSGEYPGKAYFGGDGDTTTYNAGSRIISTDGEPFYAYYEDSAATGTAVGGDEINLWGSVQSRKLDSPHPSYLFGVHEILGAPTGAINSAVQKTNGSGGIDISIEVDDISNDDCRAKIEYATGTDCVFSPSYDPTLDGTPANISADFGQPIIDNNETYQVGTTSGWIETVSGSNTVHFDWLSAVDIPTADDTYCVRLTVNDDSEDQEILATTTLTIDNVDPGTPGSLSLSSRTGETITLSLAATSSDTNFKEYIVYYKVYDGFSVTEGDTPHSSSTDANLATSTFNGATTTIISGLSAGTTYTFDIWAYDDYGNKASSTSGVDIQANDAPTSSFVSISQDSDGSGSVSISIEVDDNNNSNEVRAKIEYEAGEACTFGSPLDPTINEASTTISADFGIVVANDNETYQVGSSTGWILTAPGSNTVNFDWLSATDLPSATGTYCLRLTVSDGLDDQVTPDTATVTIDNLAPSAPGNLTEGTVGFTSVQLVYDTGNPSTDDNEPASNAYKIYYKADTSGVTQSDTEHDDSNLDGYDYSSGTSTTVSDLTVGTEYVFNIWAYDASGNSTGATEINIQTDSNLVNESLTFTNAQASGTITNIAIADGVQWNFQAEVRDVDGWGTIDEVYLRLANSNDNSSPFDDLKFKWIEASDTFSEVGTDTNNMASISVASSSSSCSGNACTLDFEIIFAKTFATTSTNYDIELYSTDDLSRTDEDTYSNIYQVRKTWLDQIHYRWRNDDGGG